MTSVPVHCQCGWTGFRPRLKIKARPCPWCDGEVRRWLKLERQETARSEILSHYVDDDPTPLEAYIEKTNEPVPPLPNPYYLRAMTGEVQIFRIPARPKRRRRIRRR